MSAPPLGPAFGTRADCPHCGSALDPAVAVCSECHGLVVVEARYQIGRLIGRGGMSVVFEGLDAVGGGPVAIKVISLESARDWKGLELFERGTQIVRGLEHRALPKIAAFTRDERGRLYQVRELYEGGTLESRVRAGRRFDRREVHGLLKALLEVLDFLQRQTPPVLHRDVKPANVMFRTPEDCAPVLVDFDTAAINEASSSSTTIVVSAGYTAPEQLMGRPQPASDLYSLGMTLLFVLGHAEPAELAQEHGRYDVSHLLSGLEPATAQVLGRMIEPDLQRRYASAAAALRDLRGLTPFKGSTEAQPERRPFWNRSLEVGGVSLFRIALGLMLGVLIGLLVLVRWQQARQEQLNSVRGMAEAQPP